MAGRSPSCRGRGYDSIRDLWLRTGLSPAVLERLARADAFRSLGLSRRDALWAIRALQRSGDKDDLPLFARVAMPEIEPDVDSAADAAGRTGRGGLPASEAVAARASGVVPARRSRSPRHPPQRRPDAAPIRPPRDRRGRGADPPAARHRQGRDLHDAGGRDRHRQHHRLAEGVRDLPSGGARRAAGQRHRQVAERERRDPCGRRPRSRISRRCCGRLSEHGHEWNRSPAATR